ncbi:uncharacterized protein BX663DRAFT_550625 [Cokeromyces recurvatus]|uniref:uncharacterized protein n=1 Tax=Cokeromyces recurvatus TaxID=90255 RepID=UPI002220BAD4|nr:uncharacterized protein BX663DRAFT_550625 [Cokeromyces recurvatus]KAI7904233.1 hypothetical protein BX663DRAFT_550625 [Cokeromyces recurvatus]
MLGPDPNKELLKDSTRLAAFLQESLLLGTLRGFRHFETILRGREELILCVFTTQTPPRNSALMPATMIETIYSKNEWNSPESISLLDMDLQKEKDKIVFLIAGYAKYRCPYVWLRSHQDQLLRNEKEEDNPLQLSTTIDWKIKNVSLWEIVAEILSMTINPKNPFELDFDYIDSLPLEEAVLLTSSLLSFLKSIWIEAEPDITFMDTGKESM